MRHFFVIAFWVWVTSVSAQQATSSFLRFGLHDGRMLAKAYLKPFGEILGTNLNSGWYSSAGIHKLGGFDITVVGTYAIVPNDGEFYDVQKLAASFENFTFNAGSPTAAAPTVAGKLLPGQQMPSLAFVKPGDGSIPIPALPNGNDFDVMLSPAIQGAVGLPFNTDLIARFMPTVSYDDFGKANLFGAGIKHSLWDDLPFLNRIPFMRLSVVAAYSHFSSDVELDNLSFTADDGNLMRVSSDALMARLVGGVDFPVVSVYAGLGYGYAKSSFDLEGTYNITDFNDSGPYSTSVKDPFSLSYAKSNIDFNVGIRVKLMFLILHADYTVSEYQALTAGVGVHFR